MSGGCAPAAVLLTPGAGSDRDHPALVELERALAPLWVERVDFPYRQAGRRVPDRAAVLVGSVVAHAGALTARLGIEPGSLVLGGRSMGGRMCSMAVAEGLAAAGLVLVSYPLHPPRRPDRLRTAHFADLAVPCLFVSGDRDPFTSPDELTDAVGAIPGPVTVEIIPGGRHDLAPAAARVGEVVRAWVRDLAG